MRRYSVVVAVGIAAVACGPSPHPAAQAGRAVTAPGAGVLDSSAAVERARNALGTDTSSYGLRVAYFARDSAGTLVDFEPTPSPGRIVVGGAVQVRVAPSGVASVVRRTQ